VNHTVFPDGCSGNTPHLSESMSTIWSPRPLGSSGPGERIAGIPVPESVTSMRISRVDPRMVMWKLARSWRMQLVASSETMSSTASSVRAGLPLRLSVAKRRAA